MRTKKVELASIKLSRPFLLWLKIEAARKRLPMYALLEKLVDRGGVRPWDNAS